MIQILSGIIIGAIVITWLLYLAVRILKSGRAAADENTRIYENRHRYPKL